MSREFAWLRCCTVRVPPTDQPDASYMLTLPWRTGLRCPRTAPRSVSSLLTANSAAHSRDCAWTSRVPAAAPIAAQSPVQSAELKRLGPWAFVAIGGEWGLKYAA